MKPWHHRAFAQIDHAVVGCRLSIARFDRDDALTVDDDRALDERRIAYGIDHAPGVNQCRRRHRRAAEHREHGRERIFELAVRPSPHLQKFDVEHQCCAAGNDATCAARTVTEFGGHHEPAPTTDFHAGDPEVPTADHLTPADFELERLAVLARAVELAAFPFGGVRLVQPAGVVHDGPAAIAGNGAFADGHVGDEWFGIAQDFSSAAVVAAFVIGVTAPAGRLGTLGPLLREHR
jgi:prepilin-type processing-associated H-X9-DG protein